MKKRQKNQRMSLILLVSGYIFILQLIVFLVVAALIIVFRQTGLLAWWLSERDWISFSLFIASVIFLVSAIIVYLSTRIPMKPVNKIINTMNRLASGDYSARLHFNTAFARHPAIEEMTDSFNEMATQLESTEVLRTDFINNFSHEFKTPIVSIAGFAKLLKRGNLSEEERMEYLDIIEEESLRLSQMATNVLNMTKVENQTILTDMTKYNLSEQIRNCMLLLERKWSKKNLELGIDFNEYYIEGNEELMKQVWINLFDNAIKFTPDYGTVEVQIEQAAIWTTVRVINIGSEISPEDQERIFQKFYQADHSHSTEGNGIGLAIVKRVITLHSGTISVESKDNKTTFTIRLRNTLDYVKPNIPKGR